MPRVIFILLMAIIDRGVRFPLDPPLLSTLRFYGLSPDQCHPNFYRIINCVSQLNMLFNLRLTQYDINLLYSYCSSLGKGYYFKVRNNRVRLISYLPDSNKNSQGGVIKVGGN